MSTTQPSTLAHRIRRWVVGAIIVSFGIAALGGIAVLLSGAWSDTAGKVLATTALTGLFSVAVLCGVTLFEKPAQWFGWVTVGFAVVTLARLLWLLWAEPSWSDSSWKLTLTLCVLTAALAVAALLLLLVSHERQFVRVLLFVTLGLMALGVLLSLLPVWEFEPSSDEAYWRSTGVVWILAALGIVVLPVTSLLLRASGQQRPGSPIAVATVGAEGQPQTQHVGEQQTSAQLAEAQPDAQPHVPESPQLSAESLGRLAVAAQAEGITVDELVHRLLPEA